MNAEAKIVEETDDDAWMPLTAEAEEHVAVAPDITEQVDRALELHPISIRLQKGLVENLKALAHLHGLGYQPLIRQILTRWVESEVKQLVAKMPESDAFVDEEPFDPPTQRRAA